MNNGSVANSPPSYPYQVIIQTPLKNQLENRTEIEHFPHEEFNFLILVLPGVQNNTTINLIIQQDRQRKTAARNGTYKSNPGKTAY